MLRWDENVCDMVYSRLWLDNAGVSGISGWVGDNTCIHSPLHSWVFLATEVLDPIFKDAVIIEVPISLTIFPNERYSHVVGTRLGS